MGKKVKKKAKAIKAWAVVLHNGNIEDLYSRRSSARTWLGIMGASHIISGTFVPNTTANRKRLGVGK